MATTDDPLFANISSSVIHPFTSDDNYPECQQSAFPTTREFE